MANFNFSPEEIDGFNHISKGRVQFYEVDSFNVVHNIRYHYWLEWARFLYMESLGIELNPKTIIRDFPLMTVHTEIDFLASGLLGMEYEVLSKIAVVKNSSLVFEHIIRSLQGIFLAKSSAVLVHVDPKGAETKRIPDYLREKIRILEKDMVTFID